MIQIDRELTGPVVGSAADESMGVGVALDPAVTFDDEIRIFFHDIDHAVLKFFKGRNIVFKGDHGVFYIIGVDIKVLGASDNFAFLTVMLVSMVGPPS